MVGKLTTGKGQWHRDGEMNGRHQSVHNIDENRESKQHKDADVNWQKV